MMSSIWVVLQVASRSVYTVSSVLVLMAFPHLSGLAASICLWRWQTEIYTPDTKT